VEVPPVRSRVQLDLPGYYEMPFSLGPTAPAELSFTLLPDVGPRDAAQAKARDGFYFAFAFFMLSLPIPMFCYSYSQDFANEYLRLSTIGSPAAMGAYNASYAFYYSYIAGLALSGSMLTWMIVNLIQYISAANRTAG
jgi:hypothetical protein